MRGAKARVLATVQGTRALSQRVRAVELRTLAPYSWRAGQHASVSLGEDGGGARYYSLASLPSAGGTVELCVGDSPDAPAFPPGGEVWLSLPEGQPAVPEPVASLVMVGIGTGVAPLRAVLLEQEALVLVPRLTLLIGFRSEADILYADEFERLAKLGLLDYRPVLSQPTEEWRGLTGHVQAHLAELPAAERYCVCGKLGLVADVHDVLAARGVSPADVFAEGY